MLHYDHYALYRVSVIHVHFLYDWLHNTWLILAISYFDMFTHAVKKQF